MKHFFTCCLVWLSLSWLALLSAPDEQEILPINQADALLKKVLLEFFQDRKSAIEIENLAGSHNANGAINLLLNDSVKKYVLRMKPLESSLQWLECEHYAMQEAAKRNISPQIYYSTEDRRAILMEFINADTLTVEQAKTPSNCKAIANTIRQAHTIPVNPYFGVSEDETVEWIFQEIDNNQKISAHVQEAIQIVRDCNASLSQYESHLVNNHGDLNSRNIFITESGPIFIDWEYTNLGNPFDDLSYFALRHNYDRPMEFAFLESYLEHSPSDEELNQYYLIKKKTFAKLCIYFHYFSLKLNLLGEAFEPLSASWADHMVSYSERKDELPLAHFYFVLACCALIEATAIEH